MSTNTNLWNPVPFPAGGVVVRPIDGPYRVEQAYERVSITASNVQSVQLSRTIPPGAMLLAARVQSASAMGYSGTSSGSGTANAYSLVAGTDGSTTIFATGTSTTTTSLIAHAPVSTASNQEAVRFQPDMGSAARVNTSTVANSLFLVPSSPTSTHIFFIGSNTSGGYLFSATGTVDVAIAYAVFDSIPNN
jgi:hypothetical protein